MRDAPALPVVLHLREMIQQNPQLRAVASSIGDPSIAYT